MKWDITAVGEVLVDLTQTGVNEQGVRQFAANPGGAPANVAVAAARLGARTAFVGKVGCDSFGDGLRATLAENGVELCGLAQDPQVHTTLAVVTVDPAGERSFAFYRDPGADTRLSEADVPPELLAESTFLHFGSVSLTTDPARAATLFAARSARKQGALISYDPNYRAALWASREEAIRQMRAPLPLVDVLKISDEEVELLSGRATPQEAARALTHQGIRLVLVTLGANGVYYRWNGAEGTVPGYSVQVADTNGAGDTFFGAVLCRLAARGGLEELEIDELEEILRFANRAASLTTSRSGAIPAMPTLDEVNESLARSL